MTVYAIAQFEIHNRDSYDKYTAQFWDVFKQFKGSLLVNDEAPKVLEGEWPKDKIVVMSFPDEAAFMEWVTSPQYREIAKHRIAGATGPVLLAQGVQF
ncbi:DUF1330 domain-containing protein [Arenicella xantha]|uniref:Uncharacterized protein (DUF1330 family) n=1 Tax=Arenicella xantha TaxID=644221 RepID=A0A395JLJ7_9GAMM|nr:DUF1330 domain-containing protein [Arenicella xantha]RBP51295.1 uncharacterized protein (DUF1330 family) [Arenicella xantha]